MDDVPRLESIAQQLAARIRDEEPWMVNAWLARELPNPRDWYRLCFVLACAVPDPAEHTWAEMTDWARPVDKREVRRRAGSITPAA